MRLLSPVPSNVLDAQGWPQFGSYQGRLPHVDFGPLHRSRLFRLMHHKRWLYMAIVSPEVFVALAVVDLGYVTNAFAFVFDLATSRMVQDLSAIGTPFAAKVDEQRGGGREAVFRDRNLLIRYKRPSTDAAADVEIKANGLELRACVKEQQTPPAISVIAAIEGGLINATEKRALFEASGEVIVGERRFSLDGALVGHDYTNGLLARHTTWRWGFALGRTTSGERVAFNIVEGFIGEAECVVWIDDGVFPLGVGIFEFDQTNPLGLWRLRTTCGSVDLTFQPGAMHSECKDFRIVSSKYVQPVGTYSGVLRVNGRTYQLERVAGVAEEQDMLW